MRLVVQRVSRAAVQVSGRTVAEIGPGLVVLAGVGVDEDEGEGETDRLAGKLVHLRIFEDEAGKMNRSLLEAGGGILVVPQFTLYGDVRRGRRPSWSKAAPPDIAERRIEQLCSALETLGATVRRGAFREHMEVELVNDGPVTIILDGSQV
ncbi:MAG TPA: D-aminoacyl-tRNA deacylase [Actinomycetota bacterium]|nr:D-aminoacyl-tRNA deacylase [Actinomycetota bacterium]